MYALCRCIWLRLVYIFNNILIDVFLEYGHANYVIIEPLPLKDKNDLKSSLPFEMAFTCTCKATHIFFWQHRAQSNPTLCWNTNVKGNPLLFWHMVRKETWRCAEVGLFHISLSCAQGLGYLNKAFHVYDTWSNADHWFTYWPYNVLTISNLYSLVEEIYDSASLEDA